MKSDGLRDELVSRANDFAPEFQRPRAVQLEAAKDVVVQDDVAAAIQEGGILTPSALHKLQQLQAAHAEEPLLHASTHGSGVIHETDAQESVPGRTGGRSVINKRILSPEGPAAWEDQVVSLRGDDLRHMVGSTQPSSPTLSKRVSVDGDGYTSQAAPHSAQRLPSRKGSSRARSDKRSESDACGRSTPGTGCGLECQGACTLCQRTGGALNLASLSPGPQPQLALSSRAASTRAATSASGGGVREDEDGEDGVDGGVGTAPSPPPLRPMGMLFRRVRQPYLEDSEMDAVWGPSGAAIAASSAATSSMWHRMSAGSAGAPLKGPNPTLKSFHSEDGTPAYGVPVAGGMEPAARAAAGHVSHVDSTWGGAGAGRAGELAHSPTAPSMLGSLLCCMGGGGSRDADDMPLIFTDLPRAAERVARPEDSASTALVSNERRSGAAKVGMATSSSFRRQFSSGRHKVMPAQGGPE